MEKREQKLLTALAMAFAASFATAPAQAGVIVYDGITYSLTASTTGSALTNRFTLTISGINGALDTEKGRYGVQSFAFSNPTHFGTATAPAGFTFESGGMNSGGCDGSGSLYCFAANTNPVGPALLANTTLTYVFDVTLTSGTFADYAPGFKINWEGTKNNYDLVARTLTPTLVGSPAAPEPASLLLFGAGLTGLAAMRYRRRRKA